MAYSDKAATAELIQSAQTLGTVAHAIVLSNYGEEAYDWDPLTVAMELKDDFGVSACPEFMDRWCAMQVVMGSDAVFQRIDAFLGVCNSLSSGEPFFGAFDPVTAEEAAWGLVEIGLNRDFLPMSHTIKAYIRTVLRKTGFDKDDMPAVFEEALGPRPKDLNIRRGLATISNEGNIGAYIQDQISDMTYQFGRLPELRGISSEVFERGLSAALGRLPAAGEATETGTQPRGI